MNYRFKRFTLILEERLYIYPLLTGLLFLVNDFRKNFIYYTLNENISLILLVIAFSFLVDFLSRKIIKNRIKAALLAVLFLIINLFYYDIFLFLVNMQGLMNILNIIYSKHPGQIVFLIIFFTWFALTFLVIKSNRFSKKLNMYLNSLFIAFIIVEIVKWIYIGPLPQIKLLDTKPFPVNSALSRDKKPDIFFIILDSYTSSESLKLYWNYDNSPFEDSLKQLGFSLPVVTKTAYENTPLCIASYFNSSWLIFDSTKHYYAWNRNFLQLIRKNRLSDWLSANGYDCHNFSPFDAFNCNKYYKGYGTEHSLHRTIWYGIAIKLYHFFKPATTIPQINLSIFNELEQFSKSRIDKPTFTYAHIFMPHVPYFFNERGEPYHDSDTICDKQKYLGQLKFANSLTLKSIKGLLSSLKSKPVIIVQGDHGSFKAVNKTLNTPYQQEAHSIFYAISLPADITMPDTINPIYTFKMLIDQIKN